MPGLTDEQVALFRQDGFLVVQGVLNDEDLAPVTAEYDALLNHHLDRQMAAPVVGSAVPMAWRRLHLFTLDGHATDHFE